VQRYPLRTPLRVLDFNLRMLDDSLKICLWLPTSPFLDKFPFADLLGVGAV
jgi:hypothetical protein